MGQSPLCVGKTAMSSTVSEYRPLPPPGFGRRVARYEREAGVRDGIRDAVFDDPARAHLSPRVRRLRGHAEALQRSPNAAVVVGAHTSPRHGVHIPVAFVSVLRSGKQPCLCRNETQHAARLIGWQRHDRVPFQIIERPQIRLRGRIA